MKQATSFTRLGVDMSSIGSSSSIEIWSRHIGAFDKFILPSSRPARSSSGSDTAKSSNKDRKEKLDATVTLKDVLVWRRAKGSRCITEETMFGI